MRGTVEIIWLEDKLADRAHLKRLDLVKKAIEDKGYESKVEQVNNLGKAKEILSNKNRRVDFFISDYNLGDGETGLEYLIDIRNQGLYKQFFVLYSNNDYDEIREGVIDKLKETRVELFSNFTFISLASGSQHTIKQDFERAVKISLSRWDELNAMRGLYMCEHAELEWLLRNRFNEFDENKTYKYLFHQLKRTVTHHYKPFHRQTFDEWEKLIELRNLLAHTSEGHDIENGFFIKSIEDENVVIYENNLDIERARLKELKEKIIFLIQNPNRQYSPSNPNGKSKEAVQI